MTDLVSRADAIKAIRKCKFDSVMPSDWYRGMEVAQDIIEDVPSAEAKPTVIRSKTLLPTKDFMEWAKRIREVNPNAVVIPCDAEVVSAEAEWIPCSDRLPSESGWYLITVQGCEKVADMEWYYSEWDAWNGVSSEQQVIAWMPLPKPYREDGEDDGED